MPYVRANMVIEMTETRLLKMLDVPCKAGMLATDEVQFYEVHPVMDIAYVVCAKTKFVNPKFVSLNSPVTRFRLKTQGV
jgi:hypothetical protein